MLRLLIATSLLLGAGCASAPPAPITEPLVVADLLSEVAALRKRNHELALENEALQAWENRTPTILALRGPTVRFRVVIEQGARRSVIVDGARARWKKPSGQVAGLSLGEEWAQLDISDALRPGRNVIRITVSGGGALDASAALWHLRPEGSVRAREAGWTQSGERTIDFWVSPYAAQAKG